WPPSPRRDGTGIHGRYVSLAHDPAVIQASRGLSRALVAVIPQHRLPQLDLVAIGIHDPGELSVFMRFRSGDDRDVGGAQLPEQFVEVVDPIVDHEGGFARAEPLA